MINNVADLYDINVQQINGDGSRQKSASKIINSIAASIKVPFERVVFALGIRFVGETSARLLARHFKTMDSLASADIAQLTEVEGIGDVIARSVMTYFRNQSNIDIINRLKAHGVQMSLSEKQMHKASDILSGKTIVISGVFTHHSRDEYKLMIESHGGRNASSISGKTSFVLAGDNMGPSKLQKAEKLGVPVINEDDFLKMINEDNQQ